MRKFLTLALTPALPALLAAAVLAGCDGGAGPGGTRAPDRASGERTTTAPTTAPSRPSTSGGAEAGGGPVTTAGPTTTEGSSPTTDPAPATTVPPASESGGGHYVCPEGGIDAVRALQQAVDEGHQPWRLSAEDVAAACTFGLTASTVEPAGDGRYRVTETATGDQVVVTLSQPLGAGTVWAVTGVTPA